MRSTCRSIEERLTTGTTYIENLKATDPGNTAQIKLAEIHFAKLLSAYEWLTDEWQAIQKEINAKFDSPAGLCYDLTQEAERWIGEKAQSITAKE